MVAIFTALFPVFVLIMLGHVLHRMSFPGPGFWQSAERFTYYVLFPVMLVYKLGSAHIPTAELKAAVGLVLAMLAAMTLLLLGLQRLVRWPGTVFTSIYQGAIRFNSFVGLAAIAALMGPAQLSMAAVVMAIMIPLLNVLCILMLARFASGTPPRWPDTLRTMVSNPLILGSLGGLLVSQAGWTFPVLLVGVLKPLSDLALPMGLMTVGAGLQLRAIRHARRELGVALLLKLLLYPALTGGLVMLLGVSADLGLVAVLISALPTASSSYILARQMGGEATLMAAIISAQTLLAILSLPLVLYGLGVQY